MASKDMQVMANEEKETFKRIETILVSQPKPERSPYYNIEEKYGLTIDWRPFIHVEGENEKDFRRNRIRIEDYSCIIFTSKNAIEHFFRLVEESRTKLSADMKYYCLSEAIANYLQKFIVYRKRKVFIGKRKIVDLKPSFDKHKAKEKYLLPCSNLGSKDVVEFLEAENVDFTDVMMYRTVASDLSDLSDVLYDVLIFFSPLGISSLYENFPDFKQNDTRIAVFGNSTRQAVEERGLTVDIFAPTPETPSMSMALEKYLAISNA